jgi:hypothetical protein
VLYKYDGLKTIWKSGLKPTVKRYCNIYIYLKLSLLL